MPGWRDIVLREFQTEVSPLFLTADPDLLLADEEIQHELAARGFDLLTYDDPVSFRLIHESKYRALLDAGQSPNKAVIVQMTSRTLEELPYDILKAGRSVRLGLNEIFPGLSYLVLSAMDRRYLDPLHKAWKQKKPGNLGDNATIDFILHDVFKLHPDQVADESELLKLLLELYASPKKIAPIFVHRTCDILYQGGRFADWPLAELMADEDYFYRFLQERWPIFLADAGGHQAKSSRESAATTYHLVTNGPAHLPLDDATVHPFISNLFLENKLKPVKFVAAGNVHHKWAHVGIQGSAGAKTDRRLDEYLSHLEGEVPKQDAAHYEWISFARNLAQLEAIYYSETKPDESIQDKVKALHSYIDTTFFPWTCSRLASLYNQPATPPAMLHHVPRFMQYYSVSASDTKVALIVLDGLSLGQWQVVREKLTQDRGDFKLAEDAIFAWVPTITSVCRQAIFSGRVPFHFASTIDSTGRDEYHWRQFWQQAGMGIGEVYFKNVTGEMIDLELLKNDIDSTPSRAVGIVVGMVDNIMHGMKLGMAGMYNQVRQWAASGFLSELIDMLIRRDYRVYLTSDHGNVEADGCGNPHEGVIAGTRSQRVRVYPSIILRDQTAKNYAGSILWEPYGLPEKYYPLLAPARQAFINKGERTVTHGGITIEELVVPFVQIDRRK